MDRVTAWGYAFVHFSVEVICFYICYRVFKISDYWWISFVVYDTLAFGLQPIVGRYAEKHGRFRPGPLGGILLLAGAAFCLILKDRIAFAFLGLILITIGNALVHISGALATLRVSEGRLSESAIFVGGGSFGLITGKLMGNMAAGWMVPFLTMSAATVVMIYLDQRIQNQYEGNAYDFENSPCKHCLVKDRNLGSIVLILFGVVLVRSYIGYGLPTAWNVTTFQNVLLYLFMGSGKMLGGVLADRYGAGKIGMLSCLLSVPILLISNHNMYFSLVGVALFSMTMAITLGGLVSALPNNPGVAFGVTTVALLLGTLPMIFFGMPTRLICNLLITICSVLAAAGLWYCMNNNLKEEIDYDVT